MPWRVCKDSVPQKLLYNEHYPLRPSSPALCNGDTFAEGKNTYSSLTYQLTIPAIKKKKISIGIHGAIRSSSFWLSEVQLKCHTPCKNSWSPKAWWKDLSFLPAQVYPEKGNVLEWIYKKDIYISFFLHLHILTFKKKLTQNGKHSCPLILW